MFLVHHASLKLSSPLYGRGGQPFIYSQNEAVAYCYGPFVHLTVCTSSNITYQGGVQVYQFVFPVAGKV